MRLRRPWRVVLPCTAALLVALVAYVGWLLWQVSSDLHAVRDDADALSQAAQSGDATEVDRSLGDLRQHARAAADRTDSWAWSLAGHAPVYGDDVRGVRLASDVVDDLAEHGLADLAQAVTDLDGVLPADGRVDTAKVGSLQTPVATGHRALSEASRRLDEQDPADFVGPLRTEYRHLQHQIDDVDSVLATADTAVRVLPAMLGADGPRNFLLVFQNNAEIRATGGLPGAVSLVRAEDGKLTMERQAAGGGFGEAARPALPLTKVERDMFGEQLGTYFLDANFTPDFPRSAALWRARWQEKQGDRVDGVVALDPVTLSYILEATGPVQVGDTTLTADTVVPTLLHDVYVKYADPADQDAYFRRAAQAIFARVSSDPGSPEQLMRALVRGAQEHRVYVHSFDPEVQDQLDGTTVAGVLRTEPTARPQVNVALNDTTGAKMSYYLRYQVDVSATYCSGGVQGLRGSAQLRSEAPADAADLPSYITGGGVYGVDPGTQIVTVRVWGPVGGAIGKVTYKSKPADVYRYRQGGRPVVETYVELAPGQVADLDWSMRTGQDQTGDADVTVTPSVEAGSSSSHAGSACS